MANRFLNNIKINDSYTLPAADGTADQVITTDGAGQLSFVDQSTLAVDSAEAVVQTIKCNEALTKGDPVYIVGFQPGQNANIVAKADASNPAKMPATGVADEDYASQDFGTMTAFGSFNGDFDTTGGTENWSIGDILYVKSGGGLTNIKPTGTNLIQNVAIVSRVQAQTGEIEVIALGRTNDIPNLTQGKIWVGSTGNTIESTVVHLDESNGRMGIGTNQPNSTLEVAGEIAANGGDGYRIDNKPWARYDINLLTLGDWDGEGMATRIMDSDSNEAIRIINDGKVGIGVTNPSEKLEVSGKILATGGQVRAGSYLESFPSFSFANDIDTGMFSDTADQLEFVTGGSSRVTINSSGNIGIGTTNPQKNLVVSDSSAPTIRIDNTKNGTWTAGEDFGGLEWYGNDASGEGAGVKGYIKLDSDNIYGAGFDMRFGTTDGTNGITERMVIAKSGNVGIGTTNPSKKLTLEGGGFSMFADGGTSADAFLVTTHNYAFADENEDTVYSYNGTDGHKFSTGGNNRLNIIQSGNVGIGQTAPTAKLEVIGTIKQKTGAGYSNYVQQSVSEAQLTFSTYSGNQATYPSAIKFSPNGSEAMRVDNDGNVGIGTTDPQVKMHASDGGTIPSIDAGTMLLASNTSATGDYSSMSIMSGTAGIASLFLGDTDSEKRGSVRYLNSTDEMRFRTANTDRVTIKGNGSVGIGTTDPAYKLDVQGQIRLKNSNFQLIFHDTDSATDEWAITTFGNTGLSFYDGATSGSAVMTLLSGGNVGIGTTSASEKLEVEGSVNNDDVAIRIENTYDDNLSTSRPAAALTFATASNNGYLRVYGAPADTAANHQIDLGSTAGSSYLTFSPNGSEKMRITSAGFVGINTTNPGYHLDVDGEARIGSTNRQNTRLLIQAEDTAGAPATTTEIRMLGYESRGQGIFFQDSGNSGEEWFAGLNYAGSWDKYSIGYDASGGQGEYVDNAILTVKGSVARVGVKTHDPRADMDVNGTIRAVGGTFTSGTSGADSNASAGIVLRRGKKLFSGIPNSGNEDFYLRSLLEQTTSGSIIIGQGGTSLISDIALKPGSSGNITFFGSGSEDMRIDSSGDVGIGTTDPASKLEVDGGDIEIDDSDRGLILRAPNGTRYRLQVANDGSLSTTAL
jgi:hypothetical protein